ncbi:glycosyltransferase family 2 protein [Desulfospira joergensenii]|uniref:glycosyltransferase family 2 protein n=1 Tax=Desulfospira joergensenii TaxID=53329 RepID=UPI000A032A53|nr:glycosyltransferase family 2 protein [Desulfospira joergensenii]
MNAPVLPAKNIFFTKRDGKEKNPCERSRWAVLTCIGMVIAATLLGLRQGPSAANLLRGTAWGNLLIGGGLFFFFLFLAELAWRAVLVFKYRPVKGCRDDWLPRCTVVVPAYNEGRQVLKTLESLAASDYPKDKVQLITVDDGSVDDTWMWIRKACRALDRPVLAIRQPSNRGKRHALYAGFTKSTGEVLITVDSDSTVETDTLRNLVAPFIRDKKVGAVAGNVRVLNMDQGILPRMIDVVFVYSFDFMRASQSMVRTVMCTPGALSAYRKSAVMSLLREWRDQTFCGRPANIGEDRAMTNLIIRAGYDVVFQQNARVYTEVPVRYTQLCRMYLRWARSNVRETIAMTRFIFTPFRRGSKLGARLNLISGWVGLTKTQIFLLTTWGMILCHPSVFGLNVMLGVILSSSLSAVLYAWKFGRFSSLLAFVYGFYFFISLVWIKPYALVTAHKSGWLTRDIPISPRKNPSDNPPILMHEV